MHVKFGKVHTVADTLCCCVLLVRGCKLSASFETISILPEQD